MKRFNEENESSLVKTKLKAHHEGSKELVPTTDLENCQQYLLPWFQVNRFAGLEHLEFRYSDKCYGSLGCFSLKSFQPNDIIFSVPQSCIFTSDKTLSTSLSRFLTDTLAKHHNSLLENRTEFYYWVHMIAIKNGLEVGIPANNQMKTYLQSLSENSPSILSWNEALLSTVQHTNLGKSIQDLKETLSSFARLIEQIREWEPTEANVYLPKDLFNYTSLLWAAGHYLSRRYPGYFGVSNASSEKVQKKSSFTLAERRSSENNNHNNDNKNNPDSLLGNLGALVPLLDILNHNHEQEWLKFLIKDGMLHVICNIPIEKVRNIFFFISFYLFHFSVIVRAKKSIPTTVTFPMDSCCSLTAIPWKKILMMNIC
jgi:hypothetical protein